MPKSGHGGPEDFGPANSAVTASDVDTFKATMKQYGHDDAAIADTLAKAGYAATDPAQTSGTPPPRKDPSAEPIIAGSRYSRAEVDGFVESLRQAGRSPEEIQAILNTEVPGFVLAPTAPDPRSDAQRDMDEQFPSPESEPIHLKLAMPIGATEAELAQANIDGRAFLHSTRLPSNIGPSLVEMMSEVATRVAGMTPQAREEWRANQEQITMRMAGGDAGIQAYLDNAAAGLGNAKSSKLWAKMAATGANFDATILSYLNQHGQRLAARKRL